MTKTSPAETKTSASHPQATRETVESIVVAIILAFLLRSFLVEPFVIPTGSMAPTLMGRHKDVECPKCGHCYKTGASSENEENQDKWTVIGTICPICRYPMQMRPDLDANQKSFNGDRIVVNKFAYDLSRPKRWDVIVFKFPGNATQNYIKRLIGLPNETIRVYHGDIFVKASEDESFHITRKPPDRQLAMLQLVDDSYHIADELVQAGWPNRWQPWMAGGQPAPETTEALEGGRRYTIHADDEQPVWLRYHHIVPTLGDWEQLKAGNKPQPVNEGAGRLITDFYAYNAGISIPEGVKYDPGIPPEEYSSARIGSDKLSRGDISETWGLHWVGDLALEADVEIRGDTGVLLLDLVEGGLHHQCRIDVATGIASLQISDETTWTSETGAGHIPLDGVKNKGDHVTGQTAIRGAGQHSVRFLNFDDELRLWVDGNLITFDGPTTFTPPQDQQPTWSPQDPGDLAPVGVGAVGLSLELNRLRVLRDVYYLALSRHPEIDQDTGPYEREDYDLPANEQEILSVLASPSLWDTTDLFRSRRAVQFRLGDDQFFPMGDNSPQSADARSWRPAPAFVEGDMLLGRAVLIYWPHGWNRPVPFTPNFRRMGVIR